MPDVGTGYVRMIDAAYHSEAQAISEILGDTAADLGLQLLGERIDHCHDQFNWAVSRETFDTRVACFHSEDEYLLFVTNPSVYFRDEFQFRTNQT